MRIAFSLLGVSLLALACSDKPLPPLRDASAVDGAPSDGGSHLDQRVFVLPDGSGRDGATVLDGPRGDRGAAADGKPADGAAVGDQRAPDLRVDTAPCGGACPSGLDCVNNTCQCVSGGSCRGCCASATSCVYPVTVTQCGVAGSACFACTPDRASDCLQYGTGYCSCHDGFGPARGECDVGQICVEDGYGYHTCVDGGS